MSKLIVPAIRLQVSPVATITIPARPKPLAKPISVSLTSLPPLIPYPELGSLVDASGKPIKLDTSQILALKLAIQGVDFSIIGKAGTGKSTLMQAISLLWLSRHTWDWIEYRIKGEGRYELAPSIAIVAYTNKAADNIRNKLMSHPTIAEKFGYNVTTVHTLLEYVVEYTINDEGVTKRRDYPKKDKDNKLAITHLVLEEASMLGVGPVSLWQQLFDALPDGVQILLLGDINQLPPVIGKSILAYALQQIPVAELTKVHRTALDNPIIRQALSCLEGKKIQQDYHGGQGVRVFHGKQKIKVATANFEVSFSRLVAKMIAAGEFDPYEDMILSPFFKDNDNAVSAKNLAKAVATIISQKEHREVYEIIVGFITMYLAVGDRVFMDKIEGIVTKIEINSMYTGKLPRTASRNMDYSGRIIGNRGAIETEAAGEDFMEYDYSAVDIDAMLSSDNEDEKKRSASHIVYIRPKRFLQGEDRADHICSSVGDFASLTLGYALSVHKAQGSEWPNVIVALHDSNAILLFRELIYTAMTRARNRLDIMAQEHVLDKAVATQRIKGNTLAAKIEYFNGGYLDQIVDISKPAKVDTALTGERDNNNE